jgi:hypothetical protein
MSVLNLADRPPARPSTPIRGKEPWLPLVKMPLLSQKGSFSPPGRALFLLFHERGTGYVGRFTPFLSSLTIGSCPVSDSNSDRSASPPTGSLYDPPADASAPPASDDDTVALRLSLPDERADRLQAVAQQLGLTPSTVAKRAIEMICDEVVTIQDDQRPPETMVEQYKARIDLLHSVAPPERETDDEAASSDDAPDGPSAPDA